MTTYQNVQDRAEAPGGWLRPDMLLFLGLVIFANTHLFGAGTALSSRLVFFPSLVADGQWWRVLTYPFVHVTWYHLALDAGAFFLLYHDLREQRVGMRMLYVLASGAVSMTTALVVAPEATANGLTGLSGIAHGLMAVTALEMVRDEERPWAGLAVLATVVLKSMYEAVSGHVIFEFMHMGLCGSPVAVCHAGGVLGGVMAFAVMNSRRKTVTAVQ
jgi:rhomboid family GlyGly-CTERM serine protease